MKKTLIPLLLVSCTPDAPTESNLLLAETQRAQERELEEAQKLGKKLYTKHKEQILQAARKGKTETCILGEDLYAPGWKEEIERIGCAAAMSFNPRKITEKTVYSGVKIFETYDVNTCKILTCFRWNKKEY